MLLQKLFCEYRRKSQKIEKNASVKSTDLLEKAQVILTSAKRSIKSVIYSADDESVKKDMSSMFLLFSVHSTSLTFRLPLRSAPLLSHQIPISRVFCPPTCGHVLCSMVISSSRNQTCIIDSLWRRQSSRLRHRPLGSRWMALITRTTRFWCSQKLSCSYLQKYTRCVAALWQIAILHALVQCLSTHLSNMSAEILY